MIILNPRLKLRGKRYASTNFRISAMHSTDKRTAIICDKGERLMTFDIGYLTFMLNLLKTPSNSTSHFDKMTVKKSLTITKIFLPDSTIIYLKQ